MNPIRRWRRSFERRVLRRPRAGFFESDGLQVRSRNLAALDDPAFSAAWDASARSYERLSGLKVDPIKWRAHICCWAATNALANPHGGDLVECGVHVGILARTICEYTGFAARDRSFWLLDTFAGVPSDMTSASERDRVDHANGTRYRRDAYAMAQENFARFPNVRLIRGRIPETLSRIDSDRIAYLSIDMNNAASERAAIEGLWERLVPGAVVVLDDYGFAGFEDQHAAMDDFVRARRLMVATLPTGQGLIVKPQAA